MVDHRRADCGADLRRVVRVQDPALARGCNVLAVEIDQRKKPAMTEQAMIGQGDCNNCNKLATEINELKVQAEIDHACYQQRESDLQGQIDALIAEKKNNLCRCEGFNTRNVGD